MAQTIHVPWYATGLRGDKLEAALQDVTPTALRYGATAWSLHRSKEDRYKFLQIVHFEDKLDFERWWEGHEMVEMRDDHLRLVAGPAALLPARARSARAGSRRRSTDADAGSRAGARAAPRPPDAARRPMPDLSTLAVFAAASLALVVVPGPSVLYIVGTSIAQGRRAGVASMLGVQAGALIHVVRGGDRRLRDPRVLGRGVRRREVRGRRVPRLARRPEAAPRR